MGRGVVDPRRADVADELLSFAHDRGVIDEAARTRARSTQLATGERIDAVLIELGLVSADDLQAMLAAFLGLPLAGDDDLAVDHAVLDKIPAEFWKRAELLPVATRSDRPRIATHDAFGDAAIEALSYELDTPLDVVLVTRLQIARLQAQALDEADRLDRTDPVSTTAEDVDVRRLKESASEAPIIRLVNRLIAAGSRARASDIHFDRFQAGLVVRFRVDGVLIEHERVASELAAATVSRLKIMAGLNIAEHRLPQDGRILTAVDGREVEIRVATTPVLHGESVVLRLLGRSSVAVELTKLGLEPATLQFLTRAVNNPHGLVLVTGPTGSGKSTTLYAMLRHLNNGQRKIISIEDPIEQAVEGITQIPVRSALGWGFADVLRTVLRHDPDVIMVGEMRDQDTARTGMQASLTGHMVLSTLHTNSAVESITRLLDLGIEPYLISATLSGIVSQRLVRRLCERCASPAQADADVSVLQKLADFSGQCTEQRLKRAIGCDHCLGTGYFGRTSISEAFVVDDAVRQLIGQRATPAALQAACQGMTTLAGAGYQKVLNGETTAAEILKAVRVSA